MSNPTQREIIDMTRKLVSDFSDLMEVYLIKMNIPLRPSFSLEGLTSWKGGLTFEDVIKIASTLLNKKSYPEGLKTRIRKKEIVTAREVVCRIGAEMGYTHENMGKSLVLNHCSVTHCCRVWESLTSTRDEYMMLWDTKIRTAISDYYIENYGKDFSKTE